MSAEKLKLLELEETGDYLFHGSGVKVEEFEPRQAHNYINGVNIPDGEPAIFATSVAEYAIFMAIISNNNCPKGHHSQAGTHAEKGTGSYSMLYKASKHTMSQLTDESFGFVYVFNKKDFKQRKEGDIEYTSVTNVKPIKNIIVKRVDLPEEIKFLD